MSFERLVDYSKAKLALLIYGYCRKMERNLCIKIPKEIADIIYLFGQFYFRWQHGSDGGGYLFDENDSMKMQYTVRQKWSILALSDYILSSEQGDKFEWEIKIDTAPETYVLTMGFVSDPISESISNWNSILKPASVYVNSYRSDIEFCESNNTNVGYFKVPSPYKSINMGVGSKFKLLFDFKEKECSIYHNGELYGIFAKNIPERVIPTISCFNQISATCTKFGAL